jgi:hypothetical protein
MISETLPGSIVDKSKINYEEKNHILNKCSFYTIRTKKRTIKAKKLPAKSPTLQQII